MDEFRGLVRTQGGTYVLTIRPATIDDDVPHQRNSSRRSWPKTTRIHLLTAQSHRCAICNGPLGLYESHIDHIIPLAAGGTDDFTNLQLTHMDCNLRKGVRADGAQQVLPWG